MSSDLYNNLWKQVHELLDKVIEQDTTIQNSRPTKDRKKAHNITADLYVQYSAICNKLNECYDQMIQPQKRLLVKKILDSVLGRILELRHELIDIDLSEFSYYDDILLKHSITPQEAEVKVPTYFRRENEKNFQQKKKFIEDVWKKLEGSFEKEEKILSLEDAVKIIQSHERARQGRLRFQFIKGLRETNERSIHQRKSETEEFDGLEAALKIQKFWRGFTARREIRKYRNEEMLLIGMSPEVVNVSANQTRVEEIRVLRYQRQEKIQKEYEEAVIAITEGIRKEQTAVMEESIRMEIRKWVNDCFKQTGKIPELPSVESGGSRMIFSRQETDSSISKSTGISSKDSKRSKRSSKDRKEDTPDQSEDEIEISFKPAPSNFLSEIIQANHDYQNIWKEKDESGNLTQLPYLNMIETEKKKEIEDEVRLKVDQELRGDIEALQAALDRDKGFRGKKSKKSPKRVKRSGKKSKKKKEKDLTPDRTFESLFEELVINNVIRLYPTVKLDEFKGEKSFANFDLREKDKDTMPAMSDIRQLIAEYCILPLGNQTIRELSPLVRSVLIAGPTGSGKKMLVYAICSELGATLFDISPSNTAGKYPGKIGAIMLTHLVCKVAKLVQPAVIFMDGADKPFVKKVPKTDKTDPKKLKKDLPRIIKSITNEDRIIFVGTSNSPWEGDQKLLNQIYDRIVFIPRPDYGTISNIWKSLLFKFSGINKNFDTSGMAKICNGFTIGSIISAINEVMTTKRRIQLKSRPLTCTELIEALSTRDPVYKEEEEAFLLWYSKTPLCKNKQKVIELEIQRMEEANEKKKKKAKKLK